MKLKKIQIRNFKGIDEATFDLSKNLNLFVGVNGSGKSSVMDALAISLSWLVNRIQREGSSGKPISETSIKNDTPSASIEVFAQDHDTFTWKISRSQKGYGQEKSELGGVSALAEKLQAQYRRNRKLPVIAYYPINRVVDNSNPFFSAAQGINTFDVYDHALGGRANYQSFFEWFRLQEDIVNEEANSSWKWLLSNKKTFAKKVGKVADVFEKAFPAEFPGDKEIQNDILERLRKDKFIVEDPRYLFLMLMELIHTNQKVSGNQPDGFYRDMENVLHKISLLSDSRREVSRRDDEYSLRNLEQLLVQLYELEYRYEFRDASGKLIMKALWQAMYLAVWLGLWWLSDRGKKDLEGLLKYKAGGRMMRDFDIPVREMRQIIRADAERYDNATRQQGRELAYVTSSIERFVNGYSNLRIKRSPKPHMLVEKDGETLNVDQLSDGEKNLIALVGDIARRLCIANRDSDSPLNGEGIILIDEIDLHLHPSWQRLMIPNLTKLFPNCQFMVTTHSPQVISHTKAEDIFLLKKERRGFVVSRPAESFGKNTDRILEDILEVDARPSEEKNMIHTLYGAIQENRLEEAKALITKLYERIGEDPDLSRAQALLKRKQTIGK